MFEVAKAALPFFFLVVAAVAVIWIFPKLVTFLPSRCSSSAEAAQPNTMRRARRRFHPGVAA